MWAGSVLSAPHVAGRLRGDPRFRQVSLMRLVGSLNPHYKPRGQLGPGPLLRLDRQWLVRHARLLVGGGGATVNGGWPDSPPLPLSSW